MFPKRLLGEWIKLQKDVKKGVQGMPRELKDWTVENLWWRSGRFRGWSEQDER